MRRMLPILLAALLCTTGAAAEAPFRLPDGDRMQVVTHGLGWTVLRDRTAPRGAADTGMVLIRAQRPVPPAARPGHLARTLRSFRPFRFDTLPAEDAVRLAGLPGSVIETRGFGAPSRAPVVVRAVCLYAPQRSWLLIASAPVDTWPGLQDEVTRLLEGFRPG